MLKSAKWWKSLRNCFFPTKEDLALVEEFLNRSYPRYRFRVPGASILGITVCWYSRRDGYMQGSTVLCPEKRDLELHYQWEGMNPPFGDGQE